MAKMHSLKNPCPFASQARGSRRTSDPDKVTCVSCIEQRTRPRIRRSAKAIRDKLAIEEAYQEQLASRLLESKDSRIVQGRVEMLRWVLGLET